MSRLRLDTPSGESIWRTSAGAICDVTSGISASTSTRRRFSATQRSTAFSSSLCATSRPMALPRIIMIRSEKITPRVALIFSSMRAVFTSRPSATSAIEESARPKDWKIALTVDHSACTPPTPRSCSCTIPDRNDATRPGTRFAAARVSEQAIGLSLVRHGGRSTASVAAGLGRFADFALHEQRDIARHFSERAGLHAARGDQRSKPIAMRVPGRVGMSEAEFAREFLAHGDALISERGQSSGRAAELQHERVVKRGVRGGTNRAATRPAIPRLSIRT